MPSELEAGDIILPPPQRPEQPVQRAAAPYVRSAVDAVSNYFLGPSWAEQAAEQSRRDREAYARGGVREVLKDTEGTQELAGGFGGGGVLGTTKAVAKGAAAGVAHGAAEALHPGDIPGGALPTLGRDPRVTGSLNPLDETPFTYNGKSPREWSPQEYKEVGEHFGVKDLGPESPPQLFQYEDGTPFHIPGGLEGKFTYYDLLALKAQGIDPSKMDRGLHTQIQQKILRTASPDELTNAHVWDGLVFGMTSPNNPLFPNQLSQSRLRLRDPKILDELAGMIDWDAGAGASITKARRMEASARIAERFGLSAQQKGGGGGLGVRGSQDYTNIAELAQMFKQDPEFFRKAASEPWDEFVERVSSQVRGLQMKTASFGSVWQDPATAAVSAIDRHMAQQFEREGGLFKNEKERAGWERRAVQRWNNGNPARPVENFNQLRKADGTEGHIGKMLLEYVGSAKDAKLRVAKPSKKMQEQFGTEPGGISPKLPQHLQTTDWVVEPDRVQVMGDAYKRALALNDQIAKQHGLGLFGSQWMEWDRIRHRLEPHENMFPGLEKIPAMSTEQLRSVRGEHSQSGHMNYAKVDEQGRLIRNVPEEERGGVYQLQPTKRRSIPSEFGYFGVLPPAAAALTAGYYEGEQEPGP